MPENTINSDDTVEDGTDANGPFRKMTPAKDIAHCSACGRQTEVVIIRDPDTDDETWYGLCCDAYGDDLPDSVRFPFGR
ncbi:hypothetical protein NXT08_24185 (plasmid) [Rhodococcus pyridinivorans]|jgi:hypothetical protein|uniref:Uncharacterized protein n=1 Tax=Rhodococcus qingshengii TaxID=334542 RepID=A0AAW6LU79_RHOSG|nr:MULTISPECIES: hypothetical protein [Rhodococcus]MCT7294209.1 hypothetical protein [Rhodococcus sp. PAE-6]MDE8648940.1 hypothetical protein [Rhodococcus qingshengii]QXU56389.1 hypothetical protein KXC42_24670 [Rhodococcus sp. LW-XY12]UQB75759.1 hypothetical protein KI427_26345 [Rhodococcus ruber]UVT27652.1 hypothetical protein NXT08_24185 [Rhodococcus pyridinivorans]